MKSNPTLSFILKVRNEAYPYPPFHNELFKEFIFIKKLCIGGMRLMMMEEETKRWRNGEKWKCEVRGRNDVYSWSFKDIFDFFHIHEAYGCDGV